MSKYEEYLSIKKQIQELSNQVSESFKETLLEESSKVFLEHPELLSFSSIGRQEYNDNTYDYYFGVDEYEVIVTLSNELTGNLEDIRTHIDSEEDLSEEEKKELEDKVEKIVGSCCEILNMFYMEDWQNFIGEENRITIKPKFIEMEY
jgi:hypothetical protein